ncbi:MAG TPA: PIG-L family deacetylase [Anaerolineales bacterium]|nr:PIG-L family deacetylase [Anaerolineales bacterium]
MKPCSISRYNVAVTWIYLSPHFDDVALSCGGLVWEQAWAGKMVSIWTICGGQPPGGELSPFAKTLHTRWEAGQAAPVERKVEDINSCHRLGASYRHFNLPDCIYRRDPSNGKYMYASEPALNGPLHPGDEPVARDLQEELCRLITMELTVVCPLALGNHVDHQLTRLAAEMLGLECLYYADFPYVLHAKAQVEKLHEEGWESQNYPISDEGLVAWQDSICAHDSQISTFWPNEAEMRRVVGQYMLENGGIRLWRHPTS